MRKFFPRISLLVATMLSLAACANSNDPIAQSTDTPPFVELLWKTGPSGSTNPSPSTIQISKDALTPWFSMRATPAAANGLLYLPTDARPHLYAIDQETGAIKWQYQAYKGSSSDVTSPVIVGDLVLFGATELYEASDPQSDADKIQSNLYAIDAASGAERWRYQAGAHITTPTIRDGVAYFGVWDETSQDVTASAIHAIDTATGSQQWVLLLRNKLITESPVVEGDYLYYVDKADSEVAHPHLHAYNIATQRESWQFELDKNRYPSKPLVANGTIYVLSNGDKLHMLKVDSYKADGDTLYAIDAVSGQSKWTYRVGPTLEDSPIYDSLYDLKPGILTAPVEHGGKIIFSIYADLADANGLGTNIEPYILALDATSGNEVWKHQVKGEADVTPIKVNVTSRYIFFGNFARNELRALDPNTGRQIWSFQTYESPVGPVVEDSGNLYTVDYEGELYALHISP